MVRTSIDVESLRQMLEEDVSITVLDVRRAGENAEWSVPGSVTFDAYDALKRGYPTELEAGADRCAVV